jgi:hypothetical protein
MSMQSVLCELFDAELAELVKGAIGHIDGFSIAQSFQEAATKMMKECLGGEDGDDRDQAMFDMLDQAKRELIEEKPAALQRNEEWRASIRLGPDWLGPDGPGDRSEFSF